MKEQGTRAQNEKKEKGGSPINKPPADAPIEPSALSQGEPKLLVRRRSIR